MEIRILTQETIELNGEQVISTKQVGTTSLEQLQKDLVAVTTERDRMQELLDGVNRKIELVNNIGENNYIIL